MRTIQRELEKLGSDFPNLADEGIRPFQWSLDRNAKIDIIPALDLPAALTFELAHAHLRPVLQSHALSHLKPHFDEAYPMLFFARKPAGGAPT